MILRLLRKDPEREAATSFYEAIVAAARRPQPFRAWGVADDPNGRFEVLAAHMLIALRRLRRDDKTTRAFSQRVFDAFFRNMDDELREMGVGDLVVGKRIRKMAEAFYGRAGAYDAALDAGDDAALTDVVRRNVFGAADDAGGATKFASYLKNADNMLQKQDTDTLLNGLIVFPDYDAASDNHE
ncbi:MAG: ubiquinol-cytochrome C chaperone family protein [Pseudomonadota bacterium]